MPLRIEQSGPDVLLWTKAVPGSSRDQISGVLGDRLKVKVAAAPEAGKANAAICRLLAMHFRLKPNQVTIEHGHNSSEKTVRLAGCSSAMIETRLAGGG